MKSPLSISYATGLLLASLHSNVILAAAPNFADPAMYNLPFFQAFVGEPVLSGRYDPVMFPNQQQSPHVHEIFGGKGFAIPWNYDNAIKSGCTDVAKKMDFSNYWYPALYHQAADGSFTKVKSELRLYYHWDGPDRVMFPQGFKMVVGNPMNRKDDSSTNEFTKSLSWTCGGTDTKSPALPANLAGCGDLVTKIFFPSCMLKGTTNNFDPTKPMANVAYPTDGKEGNTCASGYVKVPRIMLEIFFHDLGSYASKGSAKQPFTFAQGDTTGYGFHADFVNGWVDGQGGLSAAVSSGCKEGFGGNMCVTPGDSSGQCKITPFNNEEVQNPGNKLPGCNPVYPATSDCQAGNAPTGAGNGNGDGMTGDTVSSATTPAKTSRATRPSKREYVGNETEFAAEKLDDGDDGGRGEIVKPGLVRRHLGFHHRRHGSH